MESRHQNPEFRNNPENLSPIHNISIQAFVQMRQVPKYHELAHLVQ